VIDLNRRCVLVEFVPNLPEKRHFALIASNRASLISLEQKPCAASRTELLGLAQPRSHAVA
jgi:hypothetical protein